MSPPDADAPKWTGDAEAAARFGSPEAIRAALLPEQTDEFDAAIAAARRTPHLDQLRDTVQAWRRIALLTSQTPAEARRVAEVRRTGAPRPGSKSWTDLRAELGL
ncbi:DUF6247 family protein [Saccharothrix syringae]|uniref:Uncharacterized protein n=1 Tax=Saccharothrix syringae TaxID=103733 RepID=A0A5Q0H9R0_SACSY|nr:DUF6247 family protein [Saccharothrix syringae]QFZ22684.1 hypothetical protein EKG83_39355 [Saccharothrix syringae]